MLEPSAGFEICSFNAFSIMEYIFLILLNWTVSVVRLSLVSSEEENKVLRPENCLGIFLISKFSDPTIAFLAF